MILKGYNFRFKIFDFRFVWNLEFVILNLFGFCNLIFGTLSDQRERA